MEDPLAGKIAIVTGAASGMGAVMARALIEAGAKVAGIDVNGAGLSHREDEFSRSQHGRSFLKLVADVASSSDCRHVADEVLAHWGGLDILVNNAGIGMGPATPPHVEGRIRFWEADPEGWLRIVSINATGAFLMSRFAVPAMMAKGWGRIINVTTSFDTMVAPGLSAYGASKSALEASTAIWAKELAGTGITANVLVPGGPTDTAFFPPGFPRDGLLNPEIMGPPVRWLATPRSDGITGCRFIARDWDANRSPDEAAAACRSPAAWPALAESAAAQRTP